MKHELVAIETVPGKGRRVDPELAEVYKDIGRLDDKHALKFMNKVTEIERLRSAITSHFNRKKARFGFAVKVTMVKESPSPGWNTLFVEKKQLSEEQQ